MLLLKAQLGRAAAQVVNAGQTEQVSAACICDRNQQMVCLGKHPGMEAEAHVVISGYLGRL